MSPEWEAKVVREKIVVRSAYKGGRCLVRFVKYEERGSWIHAEYMPLPYGVPNKAKKLGPWKEILRAQIVLGS